MPSERAISEMGGPVETSGSVMMLDRLDAAVLPRVPVHLAIGMFDGVHLGHRAVIGAAVSAAQSDGGVGAVLTFSPHPSVLFRPDQPTRLMLPDEAKAKLVAECGVAVLVTQPFTPEFAALSDDAFVHWLKTGWPSLRAIYVGENFRFGRGRTGTPASLAAHGVRLGIAVNCVPRVELGGGPVSSTRIRALIAAGEMARANELLGRAYRCSGRVTPGKRLGRTLGFPTLNLAWSPAQLPKLGVYVVRVRAGSGGTWLPGVANYGLRPTVETDVAPRLEVHALGPCAIQEGDAIEVEWLDFLRAERKFSGLQELVAQIGTDTVAARDWFQARKIV